MKQVQLILVAGPSGVGKNSFLDRAIRDFPQLRDIVTYTTRPMRHGEKEGEPYHFIAKEYFEKRVSQDFFVEWAHVHDAMYGTSHQSLKETWDEGLVAIMEVDVQGVATFKKLYPEAASIFILPPSIEELRIRIVARDKSPPANLELRLANAEKEISQAPSFDYRVINAELDKSYAEFKKIVEELLGNA